MRAAGLPSPVVPGDTVPAGAVMYGGPFVVALQEAEPFTPEPRPAPLAPELYDHYHRYGGTVALAFGGPRPALWTGLDRGASSKPCCCSIRARPWSVWRRRTCKRATRALRKPG